MRPAVFQSHQVFLHQIQPLSQRHVLRRDGPKAFHLYRQVEAIVRSANLDFLAAILVRLYALCGRPARDPIPLLRSLVVMYHCGESSLTQWVYRLAREPILARLCGLDPHQLPRVANYYDLFHRIGMTPRTHSIVMRALQRPKGCKKGKKAPPRRPGAVNRILRRLRRHPPRPPFPLWQASFTHIVRHSAQRGLLGPQTRWTVALDGSPLPSGGNGRGHRVCGCKKQDPCTHPFKRYTDPGARIGWDSYRNRPFYGRHLSALIATGGGHDLLAYLRLFQGNRHDSVAGAVTFVEAEQLYPVGLHAWSPTAPSTPSPSTSTWTNGQPMPSLTSVSARSTARHPLPSRAAVSPAPTVVPDSAPATTTVPWPCGKGSLSIARARRVAVLAT